MIQYGLIHCLILLYAVLSWHIAHNLRNRVQFDYWSRMSLPAAYSLNLTRSGRSVLLGLVHTCKQVDSHDHALSARLVHLKYQHGDAGNSSTQLLWCWSTETHNPTAAAGDALKHWPPIHIGSPYHILTRQCNISDFSFWLIPWHKKINK